VYGRKPIQRADFGWPDEDAALQPPRSADINRYSAAETVAALPQTTDGSALCVNR
jgi:hypothetical protein